MASFRGTPQVCAGMTYGRLAVLSRASDTVCRKARWLCRCACGAERVVIGNHLRRGDSKSCGCLKAEAASIRARKPWPASFWEKVDRSGDCWTWTASLGTNGYGQVLYRGAMRKAHRVSWVLAHGAIPPGLCVCHRCDNPPCVNPAHLFLGTHAENASDRDAKGRHRYGTQVMPGSRNGMARLTEAQVLEIRARYAAGELQRPLAREFGVTQTTISAIARRARWAHLEPVAPSPSIFSPKE